MLGRIKDVQGELEENRPLQHGRQRLVQLGREGDQNAGAFRVALIRLPVVAALVPLLRPRAFLQREPGDEEKEKGEEDRAENGGVKCVSVGRAGYVAIGCWRYGDHIDC